MLADLEEYDRNIRRRTVVGMYVLTKSGPIILCNHTIGILRHRCAVEGCGPILNNPRRRDEGHDWWLAEISHTTFLVGEIAVKTCRLQDGRFIINIMGRKNLLVDKMNE